MRKIIFSTFWLFIFFISAGNLSANEVPSVQLTLAQVSRLALENNFAIQLAKYDAWMARTDLTSSQSIYDTILEAEIAHQEDESAQASSLFATKTINNNYNVGVSKKLPTGTTIQADMINNRNVTNSSFASSPISYESAMALTVKQELGRNFFGLEDRGTIKLTKLDVENSEYLSLDMIESSLAEVQKAYWDLVESKAMVKVAEDMVEQSKYLHDLHQEQLKDGLAELPDAIASDANYRERMNNLLLAKDTYQSRMNHLKLLLNITESEGIVEPAEDFTLSEIVVGAGESIKTAFTNRQDYKIKYNNVKSKNLKLTLKKNSLWPEINLTASLARNGLGDGFNEAIENIMDENHPDFYAGLKVSFPLENRKARGQWNKAKLEKARALLDLKYTERVISIAVMDQIRRCQTLKEVAENTVLIAKLQQDKLTEEQKRFNKGLSDTDTIIRFQRDALEARQQELTAKNQHAKALVDLNVIEGVLLNDYWKGDL